MLVKNGFLLQEDVKKICLVPIVVAMKQLQNLRQVKGGASIKVTSVLMRYLVQYFETLTLCAQSQHGFIEHLFSDTLALTNIRIEF